MSETITYADVQFMKALRKNTSNPRQEFDEDGDLTYENVQVHSAPEAPTGLTLPPESENQAAEAEQPAASCSKTMPTAARQMLPCHGHPCYSQCILLLTCLLLGVAAIFLGMRYLQTFQQLGQLSRVLEHTNSSLQEQLLLGKVNLGQIEKDLQDTKEQLAQSQKALEEEQRAHQAAKEQLPVCQANKEKTQETLQSVQQKLSPLQDKMRPFFTCPSQDICCAVGWIPTQGRCFHVSFTERNWQSSQEYCKSLSSNMATLRDSSWGRFYYEHSPWKSLLSQLSKDTSFWVGLSYNKGWWWSDGTPYNGFHYYISNCAMLQYNELWSLQQKACSSPLPCICEMASFRFPDGNHSA
ncbi:B-cell differentiation antigen CD72-like isoform X2 [Ochotona curzoniae]|uniref:B-cell differentiation antigen CD72-like isoform X2 n=1 Tax=Ochotona curzoniae TaxID=130825 RepID=UPI001B3459D3|nr:B-cell differentiation antigen CD72-like isoform X2 [Ochotona curzoniae]